MGEEVTNQELLVLVAYLASPIFIVVELLLFRWMMKGHRVAPKWATAVALTAGGSGVYLYGAIAKALAPPVDNSPLGKLIRNLGRFGRPDPWTAVVSAPVKEELLKGALLLPFVFTSLLSDRFHGLYYGLAVGVGFSIIENAHYFDRPTRVAALIQLIWTRTLTAPITHGLSTAAIGLTLGWFKEGPREASRLGLIGAGVLAALAWHMAWNAMVHFGTPGDGSYPAMFVVTLLGAALMVFFTRRAILRRAGAEHAASLAPSDKSGSKAPQP